MSVESQLNQSQYSRPAERTYVDKVLSRVDIERVGVLMKKTNLTRQDILDLLYLLNSSEIKLVNYDSRLRYFLAKFFVWLRDLAQQMELLFFYEDILKENKHDMTNNAKQCINSTRGLLENSFKFLVDVYLNVVRSSLSLDARGIDSLLSNKFEMNYSGSVPQQAPMIPQR